MSITSISGILYLVGIVILYYIIPKKYRPLFLLVVSLIFYYISSKLGILAILASSISIFIGSKYIAKKTDKKEKKKVLILIIIFNLILLGILKYMGLFTEIINIFGTNFKPIKLLLPLGISYYTLDAISYVVDLYQSKIECENNYLNLLLYLSYFPKMLMGPFWSYKESSDLRNAKELTWSDLRINLTHILFGYIKILVLSKRLDIFVSNAFQIPATGYQIVLAAIFYTFSLYFQFGGYIEVITGISNLLGIKLPVNFNHPFKAKDVNEFWRRWHISLGNYFKKYVFYPISFSKMNQKFNAFCKKHLNNYLGKTLIIAFPLFFVWFLNGLWHGASIKYILYGLYYFLIMMLGVIIKPISKWIIKTFNINTEVHSYKVLMQLRTFIFVCIGMMLFRADSFAGFIRDFTSIFIPTTVPLDGFGLEIADYVLIIVMIHAVMKLETFEEEVEDPFVILDKQNLYYRWFIYFSMIFIIIIFGIYGAGFNASDFVYGGF